MSQNISKKVLISGGGIGGLTAALCLRQNGFAVELFEQSADFSDVGAGIQLSANAMHVLRHLGLETAIAACSFTPQNAVMRHFQSGKVLMKTRLGKAHEARYGAPYYHTHRADLITVLAQAAQQAGVQCHMNQAITGYRQSGEAATLITDQDEFDGDIIIGADGIHSPIRTQMHPQTDAQENAARFTGQIAWRGIVPANKLPLGLIQPDATVWVGPGRHFVAYYVRNGELVNFIAIEERDAWAAEDWRQNGDMADLRRAFDGWDDAIGTLLAACTTSHLWGLFDRRPFAQWQDGRVALLGDACHPMLPFMAQGGAMAIEDAFVLAQSLQTGDTSIGLAEYADRRRSRTAMLQGISRGNADLFHASSPMDVAKRRAMFAVARLLPAASHARFDPIYGVNVTHNTER